MYAGEKLVKLIIKISRQIAKRILNDTCVAEFVIDTFNASVIAFLGVSLRSREESRLLGIILSIIRI